jgi:thiamine biosynthesis lipoprotein
MRGILIENKNDNMIPPDGPEGSFRFGKSKRIPAVILSAALLLSLLFSGCSTGNAKNAYAKYSGEFTDTFDTVVIVVAYAKSQEEFDKIFETVHGGFAGMNRLFDIYHSYEGINNIKTINDNAGKDKVKVDKLIIDLLKASKDIYRKTGGNVNVAMGPVLEIWHEYREKGINDPAEAELPSAEDLQHANRFTDIEKVIIDEEDSTVFLEEKEMSLDVGAIAKGYAAEVVARRLIDEGYDSVLISAGGNIRAIGCPKDGIRGRWGIGIKDPDSPLGWSADDGNLIDVAFVSGTSVVSSGGYERYYTVGGKDYNHIIDPKTLMPADHYKAVTVITENSADADALSTALFIMPPGESRKFVEDSEGLEALWMMPDNTIVTTPGMKRTLRDLGGAANEK